MVTAAPVDVLSDPNYWQTTERPPTVKDAVISIAATLITMAVGIVIIAIVVVVYRTTASNNDRQIKLERTCLQAGGQWIKGDCINNLIHLNG